MSKSKKQIEEYMATFRKEGGPAYRSIKRDEFLFSVFCARYFCYDSPDSNFDANDFIEDNFVDGPKDGGVDALFMDPDDSGEMVVIQAKYYDGTHLQAQGLKNELNKIRDTIIALREGKFEGFNKRLTSAYSDAVLDCDGVPPVRVFFCTTEELSEKQKESFRVVCKDRSTDDLKFSIFFAEDIISKVKDCENVSPYAPEGVLTLDRADNVLWYGDNRRAAIVNVSGNSLQLLFGHYGRNALGLNLRYHVEKGQQNKDVDTEIDKTLKTCPEDFWFRNNGILIVCDSFSIDGKKLSFKNFSIVNGGQTSHVLVHANVPSSCYLQCKIVSPGEKRPEEKEDFINKIARATNSQKPIKQSDLKANQPEQVELKKSLAKYGICYISKGGEVRKDKKFKSYQVVKLDDIGNLSVAGILLRPGSVRSEGKKMIYDDENYKYMFIDDVRAHYLADLVEATHAFKLFKKYIREEGAEKGFSAEYSVPMVENGERHFVACLSFLAKLRAKVFTYAEYKKKNDIDSVRALLRKKGRVESLFRTTVPESDREEILKKIYSILAKKVFGDCAKMASGVAESNDSKFTPSNYLKGDLSFFNDILPKLYEEYADEDSKLHDLVNQIMV